MKLTDIWMYLFGTAQWFGINIGFWISMFVCVLIVIFMNAVFWSLKPRQKAAGYSSKEGFHG